uniref:Uncharacterized protein n=1 Tax=Anguilla anguilla TaxID=7936 RepID=A0A0E9XZI1_ANGAN
MTCQQFYAVAKVI